MSNIFPLPAFTDNYIWILTDESRTFFNCVDPGEAEPVLEYAMQNSIPLRNILLTHHHLDHIGGVQKLLRHFPKAKVYGPKDDRIDVKHTSVEENAKVELPSFDFTVLSTPGHTSTHISYYETEKKWLFCGDTLFSAGCGRVFDGTMDELFHSLSRYKQLPDDTLVFSAHEYTRKNLSFAETVEPVNEKIKQYHKQLNIDVNDCSLPSTIGLEKQINPFFRTQQSSVKSFVEKQGISSENELKVFQAIRESKDRF